jgi:single-strand DNA-binding protein
MINICALQGRLTYEPELKSTPSGVSVIRFQIAVDRNYTPSGKERQADFIDCVAWRQTADFISRYFRKGSMIAIEGSIQTQNYTDKDGKQRKSVEIVCNNVSFCGDKKNGSQSVTEDNTADYEEIVGTDEDLPF